MFSSGICHFRHGVFALQKTRRNILQLLQPPQKIDLVHLNKYIWFTSTNTLGSHQQIHLIHLYKYIGFTSKIHLLHCRKYVWFISTNTFGSPQQIHLIHLIKYIWFTAENTFDSPQLISFSTSLLFPLSPLLPENLVKQLISFKKKYASLKSDMIFL